MFQDVHLFKYCMLLKSSLWCLSAVGIHHQQSWGKIEGWVYAGRCSHFKHDAPIMSTNLNFFIVRLDAGSQCISNTGSQAPSWQAYGYKCEQCRAGVQAGVQSWPIQSCNLFFLVISILLCSRWSGWVQGCKLLMC